MIQKPQNEAAQTRFGLQPLRDRILRKGRIAATRFLFLSITREDNKLTPTHSEQTSREIRLNNQPSTVQCLPYVPTDYFTTRSFYLNLITNKQNLKRRNTNRYSTHMVRHPRCVFINYNWSNQLSNTTIWWLDICCLLHRYQLHVSTLMAISS